ncbi:MAG: PfkB family carbohydrate kinase [Cyclobacteriaceae bacterium]
MNQNTLLSNTIEKLRNINQQNQPGAYVGYDGFVDNILRPVQSRGKNEVAYYNTITDFAGRIGKAAGKSGQVEMVSQQLKLGGNAPIMSYAMGSLGIPNICIGSLGYPELHAAFQPLKKVARIKNICQPGITDAFEFDDGKLIFSELSSFRMLTWDYLKSEIGLSFFKEEIEKNYLIAQVDWVNLDHATEIWRGVLQDVIIPAGIKDKNFFFDIADPSKKSREDIQEVVEVMAEYRPFGTVTLGINENESRKLYEALTGENAESKDLAEVGKTIFEKAGLDVMLIHPVDRTLTIDKNGVAEVAGRVVKKPVISTGGGDNFNAGFCLGLLHQMELEECMLCAMAASGAYVQNGSSANIPGLIKYLEVWQEEL